ncbi:MAG: hypothetical protein M3083_21635 [Actinomycetota bacterium]|nr:hypothetical protein [Actinomycetota bacterium]
MSSAGVVSGRGRVRLGSLLVSGLALVMALWMAPAYACTVAAVVQARPGRGDPGGLVRIEGSGFELHGSPVSVYWGGQSHGALLATAAVTNGSFAVDVAVPVNAVPHSQYLIEAIEEGSPSYSGTTLLSIAAQASGVAHAPVVASGARAPVPQGHQGAGGAAPAPVVEPAGGAAVQPAAPSQAVSAPADGSGFSQAGAAAFSSGGQPVAPVGSSGGGFGGVPHRVGGVSPLVLVPLGVLGLGLFSAGAAAALRQVKREGVRATI